MTMAVNSSHGADGRKPAAPATSHGPVRPTLWGVDQLYREVKRKTARANPEPIWSGRRDSNPRPSPWQGDALPLSHFRVPRLPAAWRTIAMPPGHCQAVTRAGEADLRPERQGEICPSIPVNRAFRDVDHRYGQTVNSFPGHNELMRMEVRGCLHRGQVHWSGSQWLS